jgi:hypothetical protein
MRDGEVYQLSECSRLFRFLIRSFDRSACIDLFLDGSGGRMISFNASVATLERLL